MPISGGQIWIGDVLAELSTVEKVDARQAAIDVFDVLARMGFVKMMKTMVTDGNTTLDHPDPILVENYRAKLPCSMVQFIRAFEISTFQRLRHTELSSIQVNLNNNRFNETFTPDFWKNKIPVEYALPEMDVRDGYIYVNFKTGYLVVIYTVPPTDKDGRLMIPSDPHIINLAKTTAIYKAYERLWEAGVIADKVFQRREQDYLWAKANTVGESNMPTEEELEFTKNLLKTYLDTDRHFENHFAGLGRNEDFLAQ